MFVNNCINKKPDTTYVVVVRGQVQHVARVHPRPEFQEPGLLIVRPIRQVRLTVNGVLYRFHPNHRPVAVHHAVDARPVVFYVGVNAGIVNI